MHVEDRGLGPPVVLLHGTPTSCGGFRAARGEAGQPTPGSRASPPGVRAHAAPRPPLLARGRHRGARAILDRRRRSADGLRGALGRRVQGGFDCVAPSGWRVAPRVVGAGGGPRSRRRAGLSRYRGRDALRDVRSPAVVARPDGEPGIGGTQPGPRRAGAGLVGCSTVVRRLRRARRGGGRRRFRPRLRELTCPVLVCAGTADRAIPLAWSEDVARRSPHGTLEGIDGAGHALLLEAGDRTTALLDDFLSRPSIAG